MTTVEPASPDARHVPPSALVLVAANLVPLVGVLAFHWTVFSVLLLYWCENVVVGAFNVLRMLFASPQSAAADASKLLLVPFFVVHYGIFALVHGIFVLTLFGPGGLAASNPAALVSAVRAAGVWPAVLAMVLSHGFSFAHNYLLSGEFRRASVQQLMAQPYARVMILHFTILVGGFAAKAVGAPAPALIVLIALKTAIDLRAHLAERQKLGAVSPP